METLESGVSGDEWLCSCTVGSRTKESRLKL